MENKQNSSCEFRIGAKEKVVAAKSQTSLGIRVKGRREASIKIIEGRCGEACILNSIEGWREICIKSIEAVEKGNIGWCLIAQSIEKLSGFINDNLQPTLRNCSSIHVME